MNRLFVLSLVTALATAAPHQVWGQTALTEQTQSAEEPAAAVLSPMQMSIKQELTKLPVGNKAQKARATQISGWYESRQYEPIWVENGKVSKNAEKTVLQLLTSYKDGLEPADYASPHLVPGMKKFQAADLAAYEVKLSNAAVIYGQHLRSGRVAPNSINREVKIFPERLSADKLLDRLKASKTPAVELATLSPQTDRYARLRDHLLALKLQQAGGGWIQVPEGEVLKPGMEDERIEALRKRLKQSGDLTSDVSGSNIYDDQLVEAVKKFQARLGLAIDGVIGPATLAQMNITIDQRIDQVVLNLERRRWMQADFGRTYIFVNLADQVLKLVKDDDTLHAELVQVGLPYHRTPVFSDQMSYLEFNPYWNVPYSIATKEYLPKLKRNPYALQSQNIRVLSNGKSINPGSVPWGSYSRGNFPFRLRQDPGQKNALGRVKFMFPNKFNVYIHDTPSKSKFAKDSRYFSHGCVRLRSPMDLAEKILGMQGVSRTKIDNIVASKKRTVVKLKEKLPVHITYLTAWVNKDGSVHYRRDIYGRDKILAKALFVGT
ncbi:MAG: L,D-transpeptidase family protein [Rhizobiaceae bacterium]